MIIVRISGGLGNQMFQYAIGKSLAKRNNDSLYLDKSFYQKQNLRKYELELFKIDENIAKVSDINSLKGKEGFLFKVKKKLKLKPKKPKSYIIDSLSKNTAKYTENIFEEHVLNLKGNLYLDGYWQSYKYFKDIKKDIINDFTPRNKLSREAIKYIDSIESSNSVSLHVRRGDYVDNTMFKESGLTLTEIPYYKDAINYISYKVKNPKYFIFSDDIDWCKEMFDFLEDKVFVDNTKSAIDDMMLMSKCKDNIIANSTFSWWAAWLNQSQKKIVIAPKIWYKTNHQLHLAPKEWILI